MYATIAREWDGDVVAILASGPSLCAEDVDYCRGKARLLAVKDAIKLAPDADCLYGYDATFWMLHRGFPQFAKPKYTIEPAAVRYGPQLLRNTGQTGLDLDPSSLRHGNNSTYQAINLAVHYGVRLIVVLGLDMDQPPHGPKYFYGDRGPSQPRSDFPKQRLLFATLLEPLAALGVRIVNCSRRTALECFDRLPLREVLA